MIDNRATIEVSIGIETFYYGKLTRHYKFIFQRIRYRKCALLLTFLFVTFSPTNYNV